MAGPLDSPLYGMFRVASRIRSEPPGGHLLPQHYIGQPTTTSDYSLKWDGEWQVTYDTFRDMGLAYSVGLVLIYLLVVAQFGSYWVPLVIMAPIPLTIIGVLPGHALLGAQFTATSMIGMIALAGIIVRNSILLVDFVNQELAAGATLEAAVVRAGAVRAKPIALTALAAVLGAFFILDDPIFNGLAVALDLRHRRVDAADARRDPGAVLCGAGPNSAPRHDCAGHDAQCRVNPRRSRFGSTSCSSCSTRSIRRRFASATSIPTARSSSSHGRASCRASSRYAIEIRVDRERPPTLTRADVVAAVHGHFMRAASLQDLRRRRMMREGRLSLAIGLAALVACIGTATLAPLEALGTPGEILRESLIIAGWVVMWHPLEVLLYGLWPVVRERRLLERLAAADVGAGDR